MATYVFKAIENSGNTIEGSRDADDEQSLVRQLQAEGYIPISVALESSQPFNWLKFGKALPPVCSHPAGLCGRGPARGQWPYTKLRLAGFAVHQITPYAVAPTAFSAISA